VVVDPEPVDAHLLGEDGRVAQVPPSPTERVDEQIDVHVRDRTDPRQADVVRERRAIRTCG
jgi:hypothetical protein